MLIRAGLPGRRSLAWLRKNTPLPYPASTEDFTGAVLWLASDAGRYVTGQWSRTAADEHAVTEISALTDQAAAAAQAVRESMRQLGLAAAALALPEAGAE
jgi:hypothetical protein